MLIAIIIISPDSENWDNFMQTYMQAWKRRIQNWVLQEHADHPVLLVRYEDLKLNTVKEVERMLTFLHQPFDPEEIASKIAEDFTTFKRPHADGDFERFTDSQKLYMESVLLETIKHTQNSNMTQGLKLDGYLRNITS